MRHILFALCLVLAALPQGCSHSDAYLQEKWRNNQLATDTYNCRWALTHPQAVDGTLSTRDVPEEELDAQVRQCLEAKGHDFSKPAEKKESGWWPW